MDKSNRKPHDAKRALAVKYVASHFDCTESHVRSIINGTFTGGKASEIRAEYNQKYNELKAILG